VRPLPVDWGKSISLPVSHRILVHAKAITEFAGGVVSMDLDEVWVSSPPTHLDVNAKSRSDFR
jgi:hypothetical protein